MHTVSSAQLQTIFANVLARIKCEINQLQQTPYYHYFSLRWNDSRLFSHWPLYRCWWFGLGVKLLNYYSSNVRWMVNKLWYHKIIMMDDDDTFRQDDFVTFFPLLSLPLSVFPLLRHWALTSFDVHLKRMLRCLMPDAWCIVNIIYFYDHVHFDIIFLLISKAINEIDYKDEENQENTNIFPKPWIMDHHKVTIPFNLPHKRFSHAHCLWYCIKAHNQSNGKCEMGLTVSYKIHILPSFLCYL